MKCGEVQFQLWNGTTTEEMKEHLRTCPDCQRENRAMQHIFDKMHTIETPKPTRSLRPSMDVIAEAVEQNRRRRTRKYTVMAASITVLLGALSGLALQNGSSVPEKNAANLAQNARKSAVPYQVAPNAAHTDICNAIGQYLASTWNTESVKNLVVTGFSGTIDATNTLATGDVTFDADLQTGATMNITQGTNKSRVVLRFVNGAWSVTDMEATVAPTSPEEAESLWVQALTKRNGTLEYSLLAPELKQSARAEYERLHFVVNGSSPWVKDAVVTNSQHLQDGTYQMTVAMRLQTSGGPQGVQTANLYLRKYGTNWYIYKREYTNVAGNAVSSTLQLPNAAHTLLDSANPAGGNQSSVDLYTVALRTMGFEMQEDALGVVASAGQTVLHSEDVPLQGQTAKLVLVETTLDSQNRNWQASAATSLEPLVQQKTTKHNEYWLVVDRAPQLLANIKLAYALTLAFPKGHEADAKQKLLELAKSWQLPSE